MASRRAHGGGGARKGGGDAREPCAGGGQAGRMGSRSRASSSAITAMKAET